MLDYKYNHKAEMPLYLYCKIDLACNPTAMVMIVYVLYCDGIFSHKSFVETCLSLRSCLSFQCILYIRNCMKCVLNKYVTAFTLCSRNTNKNIFQLGVTWRMYYVTALFINSTHALDILITAIMSYIMKFKLIISM
jgi:hypothetical protein